MSAWGLINTHTEVATIIIIMASYDLVSIAQMLCLVFVYCRIGISPRMQRADLRLQHRFC